MSNIPTDLLRTLITVVDQRSFTRAARVRATSLGATGPVPLVSFREDCIYYRTAVNTLNRAGRKSELMFIGPTIVSLAAAVSAGFGVIALPRSRCVVGRSAAVGERAVAQAARSCLGGIPA